MKNNTGQAALIIILVTAVVVTIIVSSVARTVVDVRISTQSEESYQALNAAESGLEYALLVLNADPLETDSDCPSFDDALAASPDCTVDHVEQDGTTTPSQSVYWYKLGEAYPPDTVDVYSLGSINEGDVATIWLTDQPYATDISGMFDPPANLYDGTFDIEFSTSSPACYAEITILYENGGNLLLDRHLHTCAFGTTITFDTDTAPYSNRAGMIRIRILGGSSIPLNVRDISDPAGFPPQARTIEAHGHYIGSGQAGQSISKSLSILRWHDDLPVWFDYVLYSGGSVEK